MCYTSRYFFKNLYKSYEMDFIGFGFIETETDPECSWWKPCKPPMACIRGYCQKEGKF